MDRASSPEQTPTVSLLGNLTSLRKDITKANHRPDPETVADRSLSDNMEERLIKVVFALYD